VCLIIVFVSQPKFRKSYIPMSSTLILTPALHSFRCFVCITTLIEAQRQVDVRCRYRLSLISRALNYVSKQRSQQKTTNRCSKGSCLHKSKQPTDHPSLSSQAFAAEPFVNLQDVRVGGRIIDLACAVNWLSIFLSIELIEGMHAPHFLLLE
jgi:hypothetical protein